MLDFVAGLTRLPSLRQSLLYDEDAVATAFTTDPSLLRKLYSLPSAPATTKGNLQAVAAFNNESFLPSDLLQFQQLQKLPVFPATAFGPATLKGAATGEGSLDVDYVTGVCPSTATVVWATAGQKYDPMNQAFDNEPFLAWIVNASSTPPPTPFVFSISYQDYEDTVPRAFMDRVSTEFAAIGMRGTTIVTSSGDWGVGCSDDYNPLKKKKHFRSDFPSSSPYVLSVGATTFADGALPAVGKEVGVSFSSGGFSNHFSRPSYQQDAVDAFLQRSKVDTALFNRSGRGFPDVSAVGVSYEIICNTKVQKVGGTSASTPALAGIISLLNAARLAKGKPTLGWVNPALYHAHESGGAFFDVTEGNNKHRSCCGFNATTGWDPMTGVGTPNYPTLLAALC
jgi:tripeptidyl-peptidase-1